MMSADKVFFNHCYGISALLSKGMKMDFPGGGIPLNLEQERNRYIPYNCRCEAIGDCRDKGGLYRSLEGKWETVCSGGAYAYRRLFKLPGEWSERRLYLILEDCSEKTAVYINGTLACVFCGKRDFAETQISAYVRFDTENKIVIVSEGENACVRCRASIFARKFIHIRDFNIERTPSSVKADVLMSRNIPAEITFEAYNEDLELLGSVSQKINGRAEAEIDTEDSVRLVLLICGDEVLSYTFEPFCRPSLPAGEELPETDSIYSAKALDLNDGRVIIIRSEDTGASEEAFVYKVKTENGVYTEGCFNAVFEASGDKFISENKIPYEIPSLSFYEFFLDIEKDGASIAQFRLPVRQTACEKVFSPDMPKLNFKIFEDKYLEAKGLNYAFNFNLANGVLSDISKEECSVLCGESSFDFQSDGNSFIVTHEKSRVISCDESHVAVSSSYSAGFGDDLFAFSVLWIIFGDGQISASVSGFFTGSKKDGTLKFNLPAADNLQNIKVYGEVSQRAGVYNGSFSDKSLHNVHFASVRWVYAYGDRVPGIFVKALPSLDVRMENKDGINRISIDFSPDVSGTIAASFVLKAVFCENEDIVREARIVPSVK